ncbi:MAG: DUF3572 family protein [Rhodospirillaceae bacterium]|nr:DUF3572 family protein [Rhodospirillaceae bacterium]
MDGAAAETIALQALAFLVSEEAVLRGFMSQSGTTAGDLRTGAEDPQFLAGVLNFLLEQDERLLDFCGQADVTPVQTRRALAALGDAPA